jgi:hypothetical protein
MSPTDNTPDFENMSPEEVMAWMESLAKRQGANEGFTTAADIDVPEIDPTTAIIDEPGYVPYGQEETARKSPPPAPPVVMSPPAAPPVVAVPPPPPLPPPLPVALPLPEPEPLLPSFMAAAAEPEPALETAMGENALAWLESLAADQGQSDFTLDLSSLEPEPAAARPAYDPQAWLRDLQAEPEISAPLQNPEPVTDPNAWLGELARASGTFDEPAPAAAEPLRLENPSSLLDTFAAAAGFEDDAVRAELPLREQPEVDMSYEGIQRAIHEGIVTPEQIRRFQELSMERAAQIPEPELEDEADLDMPLAPPEIPDWLAAAKPEEPAPRRTGNLPPLESLFEVVPAAAPTPDIEIPNWLMDEGAETESVEAIFAVEVNPDDPWVEALDAEFQGEVSDDVVPDWYLRNVNDPQRIAAIEGEPVPAMPDVLEEPVFELAAAPMIITQSVTLAEAALPSETSLPAGARQAVPAWMITQSMPVVAQSEVTEAAPAEFDGLPNWLVTDEQPAVLPDWTPQEVIESPHAEVIFETPPVYAAPPPVAPPPPAAAAAEATLEQARARYQTGDIDGSLAVYELLIRASQGLEAVAADVAVIARTEKNAAAFRVLGDSLMRQGRLQDALNTYREALNLL